MSAAAWNGPDALPGPADSAGGGSGGGPLDGQDHSESVNGNWDVSANKVTLCAQPGMPPAIPEDSVIDVLATGMGVGGRVNIRGSQGVRVTAGPPVGLPADSRMTNGVEVAVSDLGTISLARGVLPGPAQQTVDITPAGIRIDAGAMPVMISSLSAITLSVADGVAELRISPEGVTIHALSITLSAQLAASIQGLTSTSITSAANVKITAPLTMIG